MNADWTRGLDWYVDRLNHHLPFTYLSYGDGEFYAAAGHRSGAVMQNGEVVTPELEEELCHSLHLGDIPNNPVVRGTDRFFLEPHTYGGRDQSTIRDIARTVRSLLTSEGVINNLTWYDGTVWDNACRTGRLGSLISALRRSDVVFVGNRRLRDALPFPYRAAAEVPEENACARLNRLEEELSEVDDPWVFVLCMGLGAIPLICRLKKFCHPRATFLDLGSSLDLFGKLGSQRGWRAELYCDDAAWRQLVDTNLIPGDEHGRS